jgi:hypothetical protein
LLLCFVNPFNPILSTGANHQLCKFFSGGVYERVNVLNEYLNLKHKMMLALEKTQLKNLLFNRKDTTLEIRQYQGVNQVIL